MALFDTDVFVLGGGPAGLAAAIAARAKGFTVTVADAAQPPIDKACGEGLMPEALSVAASLGVQITGEHGMPFRGIAFRGESHSVSADFPSGAGMGIRRPVLQRLLAARAHEVGVGLQWKTPTMGVHGHTVSLAKGKMNARWIIGADGAQSSLRRWTGLHSSVSSAERFSYRRHYRLTPWSKYVEIHWGPGCQFYITPVSPHEISVVFMSHDPQLRIDKTLALFPELQSRIGNAEPATRERGAIAATRKLRHVTEGNVALVGDASGTVDPITGDGICLALKQAQILAEALVRADLPMYEQAHRRIARLPRFMARFMLLMDRSNLLQNRALQSFERHPALFQNLLAMHLGQLAPADFLKTATLLGWSVATLG